jgi:hypothetical protein
MPPRVKSQEEKAAIVAKAKATREANQKRRLEATSAAAKRKADGAAESDERQMRKRRAHAGGKGEAQATMEARAFWSTYDTPLLYTWMLDYGDPFLVSPAQANDRVHILNMLVQHRERFLEPDDEDDDPLGELRAVWAQHTKAHRGDPPGLFPGDSEEAEAEEEEEEEEQKQPAPYTPAKSGSAGTEIPETRKKSPSKKLAGSFEAAANDTDMDSFMRFTTCRTCLTARVDVNSLVNQWLCQACGLRGDCRTDAKENIVLAQRQVLRSPGGAPPSGASAAAASVSSAGTRLNDNTSRGQSRVENEFRILAAAGRPIPAFQVAAHADAQAEAVATAAREALVRSAFEMGRESYLGDRYIAPMPDLVRLIQSGKLTHVGWAIPRAIDAPTLEGELPDTYTISSAGALTARSAALSAPSLPSLEVFMQALHGTILPALSAQPAAMAQWFSLTRTVLQVTEKFGWPAARSYLSTVLYDRTLQGTDFSPVHHNSIMDFAVARTQTGGQNPRQHPPPPSFPPGVQPPRNLRREGAGVNTGPVCRQFNSEKGCSYPSCRFRHSCANCTAKGHGEFMCPSRLTAATPTTPSVASSPTS